MTSFSDAASAAESLRARSVRLAEGLQAAQQREASAVSADGTVVVRAAGRRLLEVRVDAADRVPEGQLVASIEQAVRAALARNAEEIMAASNDLAREAR